MKILILYTYNKGLLSEFFQELSEKLVKDDFEVANFYLKHKKDNFIKNGVVIFGQKRNGFFHNYFHIYKVIKKTKPDVVISNFNYINPAVLFGKLLGVKHNIAWFHTAFGHAKPNKLRVFNKALYLNMADIVLANSKSLQNEMHNVYKVPKHKTRRVPFWTNISNYGFDLNTLVLNKTPTIINIGCPGRLLDNKNHALVIHALHQLKQSHSQQLRLYIAGDGPYKKQLQQLVSELNLKQEVIFLGVLNVNEMVSFYQTMNVVVLPSFHEAFGLVFIEAIAMGSPVLVSKSFGALDFIDKQKFPLEDFCFNPENIKELIDKLVPYLAHKGLTPTYFKQMYQDTFDKDVIFNEVKAVILNQKSIV